MNLQESIRRILREIEEDRIQIRLGRSAERHFGTVQNIIIQVDNEDITGQDGEPGLGKMNIVIKDGEIIVGDIFIPEKYRRQGIATQVYQKISDHFGLPIVNSKTKGFNQTMEGGYMWKDREKFEPRNLQESIRKVLREELESKWNTENTYDYQHGYCHYFAYNIIGRLKKLYPNKNIRYYLILAYEIYDFDEGEVEQSYLIHAYIKIDDLYLDSNGFATEDEIEKRTQDWYDGQLEELPEDYRIDIWHDEYNRIPRKFINSQFCDTSIIKKDIQKFLSHPEVRELLKIID